MISSFAFDKMLSRFSMFTKSSGYNIARTVFPKLSERTKQNPKNESNVTIDNTIENLSKYRPRKFIFG